MFFPKFVYMTKNIPFFPILHVFAPLNDVRAYSAWDWKTTLITWIFGRAWYPPWHSSGPQGRAFGARASCSIFLAPPALVFGVNCLESSLWQRLWRRGKSTPGTLVIPRGGERPLSKGGYLFGLWQWHSHPKCSLQVDALNFKHCMEHVFVLKSSKSQDILVKIGCFTQNGDLSNTHTPTPAHIHKFMFGFLHFGAVVRFV